MFHLKKKKNRFSVIPSNASCLWIGFVSLICDFIGESVFFFCLVTIYTGVLTILYFCTSFNYNDNLYIYHFILFLFFYFWFPWRSGATLWEMVHICLIFCIKKNKKKLRLYVKDLVDYGILKSEKCFHIRSIFNHNCCNANILISFSGTHPNVFVLCIYLKVICHIVCSNIITV